MIEVVDGIEQPYSIEGWISGCARCGQYHRVTWLRFRNPIVDVDGTIWRYWALCSKTGEPVLLRHVTKDTTTP